MVRTEIGILLLLAGFLVCIGLPTNPYAPQALKGPLAAFLLVPCLLLVLLRRNPLRCGLGVGDWRRGLRLLAFWTAGVLVTCFLLSRLDSFRGYYGSPRWGTGDPRILAAAEGRRLLELTGWEFLFRGFLLFPLYGVLGNTANLLQASLCALTHVQKPLLEFYGAFPFALILGDMARRTGSIWYGVALHWLLGFSLEFFVALGTQGRLLFF